MLIIIGWIVAGVLAAVVVRVLRAIRIDQLADKAGITGFLKRANVRADAAGVAAGLVKWYVRLVFLLLAANAVGLTAVSGVVSSVLAFIPNLIVAMVILGVFSWLASTAKNFVSGAMEGAGLPNASGIGAIAFGAVLAFGIVAAADQLGVAQTIVNTLFMGVVAALALAFGLAFGLGGQQQAAQIWADWRGSANGALAKGDGHVQGRQIPMQDEEARRQRERISQAS